MAHPGALPLGQAEGALELGAARQQRPRGSASMQGEARRDIAPRAAQEGGPPRPGHSGHPHDAVVGARLDRAVVHEEEIGDRAQARAGIGIVEGDRLVGHVATGHHQRRAGITEQQVVQGGVGEHHAELRSTGRHRSGHRKTEAVRPAGGEHDRPLGRGEQVPFGVAQRHQALRFGDAGDHQRERLVLAVLARAQRGHHRLVVGAAREVIPADALDGENRAVAQRGRGRGHRVIAAPGRRHLAVARHQRHARTARRTGVGLGVKAPVPGVLVLRAAGGAHGKARHSGERPVIGDSAHDREAGAAVGAVDERIAVAPVRGVPQLAPAVGAHRGVGRDRGVGCLAVRALADREPRLPRCRELLEGHVLDDRQRRGLRAEPAKEDPHRRIVPFHLGQDAVGVVEHEASQPELAGHSVDVGAKSDALHGAADAHSGPAPVPDGRLQAHPTSSRSAWYALAWASWMRGMCSERVTTTWSARPSCAMRPPS